jgi:hypothetical protein
MRQTRHHRHQVDPGEGWTSRLRTDHVTVKLKQVRKTLSSLVLGKHCQVDGAGVFGCLVSADTYDLGDHGA